MPYNPTKNNRRTIRLSGYDYSRRGAYFVTLCVHNRECLFGKIEKGKLQLNDAGKYANKCWMDIPGHFPFMQLDEYIIMPNHVHGILILRDFFVGANNHSPECTDQPGANNHSPLRKPPNRVCGTSKTIGSVVRGFKIGVTKWFHDKSPNAIVWQRNYYEHICHDENELIRIRQYIRDNPSNWGSDEENMVSKTPRYVAMLNPQRPYL
jgi:REP element-mobilizing transposase RayT